MKTQEELNVIKKEIETLNNKLTELTENSLKKNWSRSLVALIQTTSQ